MYMKQMVIILKNNMIIIEINIDEDLCYYNFYNNMCLKKF
jgi:hypothetical protein